MIPEYWMHEQKTSNTDTVTAYIQQSTWNAH